eukprot:g3722.t1
MASFPDTARPITPKYYRKNTPVVRQNTPGAFCFSQTSQIQPRQVDISNRQQQYYRSEPRMQMSRSPYDSWGLHNMRSTTPFMIPRGKQINVSPYEAMILQNVASTTPFLIPNRNCGPTKRVRGIHYENNMNDPNQSFDNLYTIKRERLHSDNATYLGGNGNMNRKTARRTPANVSSSLLLSSERSNRSRIHPRRIFASHSKLQKTPKSSKKTHLKRNVSTTKKSKMKKKKDTVKIALSQSRAFEVGLAAIDLSDQTTVKLSQLADNRNFTKTLALLQALNPRVVLVPDTLLQGTLVSSIERFFKEVEVIPCQRKFFNEANGADLVAKHGANAVETDLKTKYLPLASLSCLIQHTEEYERLLFAARSMRIQWVDLEGHMIIDHVSARHLEIVTNARTGKQKAGTLFAIINRTKTTVGARKLRSTLLCPPSDPGTIEVRLDTVESLLSNGEVFFKVRDILAKFTNLDVLMNQLASKAKFEEPSVATAKSSIVSLISLKHVLELLPGLADALSTLLEEEEVSKASKTTLINAMHRTFVDPCISRLRSEISRVFAEDTTFSKNALKLQMQAVFSVKQNIDDDLDVERECFSGICTEIEELVNRKREEWDLPDAILHHTAGRGYVLKISLEFEDALPTTELLQAVRKGKWIHWTIRELLSLNSQLQRSLKRIYLRTDRVVELLKESLRSDVEVLVRVSEAVAQLDMLAGFACLVTESEDYTRPTFHGKNKGPLLIKACRHPILEVIAKDKFVANDVSLIGGLSGNVQIVTGANGSGKSTYIRQIALIQILAQSGSFVPATSAQLRICDRLFTRIGVEDDMEINASTFAVEMKETAYIIENVTPHSLIIIDELGRGTSLSDGVALAWAICEELQSSEASVFFATHFHQLTTLSEVYSTISNVHLQSGVHRLVDGPTNDTEKYGIKTAELCGFPKSVVKRAQEIHVILAPNLNCKTVVDCDHAAERLERKRIVSRMRLLQQIRGEADQTHYGKMVRSFCQRIRDQHQVLLNAEASNKE